MSHITNSVQIFTPGSGGTVNIQDDIANEIIVVLNTGGVLATLTMNMPPNPIKGQMIRVCGPTTVTLLTLIGGTINGAIASITGNALGTAFVYTGAAWQRC